MPRFYMVPPAFFRVSYSINPWMKPEDWKESDQIFAWSQWGHLVRTLEGLGAEVIQATPFHDVPDLVFTANHAVVLNRQAALCNFRYPERQAELQRVLNFFLGGSCPGINASIPFPHNVFFEGAGDCIWDPYRRQFWMGHGPRTSKAAAKYLRDFFNVPVTTLELKDPRFYHLDTAFHVLPQGEIVYYPPAFTEEDRKKIHRLSEKTTVLSEKDASVFAANAISWNKNVVMSECSLDLWEALKKWGYQIHFVPLMAFHKSGGSAYCLTLRLDNA